ncbi:hypothetical protein Z045_08995 [Rhodococcus pyridinivorans KG-16]|uniref:Uncharacterized protein n=1 Tax=Rhodococcus pyridinivorans KG-16 TaxID=1441730 RepID=A0A0V9UN71_9NOCA|nr:hypothetical protein [Rhodococcus pyridinivorans]KSZ59437.1 hypothetical protein Z045_08995 [Rhodococcus pyridinivorans KG-16]
MTTTSGRREAEDIAFKLATAHLRFAGILHNRLEQDTYTIEPGSDLAADHHRLPDLRLVDSVNRSLYHSFDNLWALNVLLQSDGPQHFAPYTLIRAALETSATAVWLLAPDRQEERLTRRIRLEIDDASEAKKVANAAGRDGNSEWKRRKSDLDSALERAGLPRPADDRLTYVTIVKDIDEAPGTQLSTEVAWRVCSGMTHGKLYAFQALATEENKRLTEDGLIEADYTPSWHSLAVVLETTVRNLHRAHQLYELRRTPVCSR